MHQVVILAAGLGSRLGRPYPKTLTELADGRTILGQQLDNVRGVWGDDVRVTVVVGFKRDLIMEAHPDLLYAYNERYDTTNTATSLLRALRLSFPGGVMWLNGDVVFSPRLLERVAPQVIAGTSFVCVDTGTVGDEEIAYTVDHAGSIVALRKGLADARGEAVGINFVAEQDKRALVSGLEACDDSAYFERGIEIGISRGELTIVAADIGDLTAIEIDFPDDLDRANATLPRSHMRRGQS